MPDAPSLADDALAALRETLSRAGYHEASVKRALGTPIGGSHRPQQMPIYVRRLDDDEPLHVLVKLFRLHVDVDIDVARDVLGDIEALARGNVLSLDGAARGAIGMKEFAGRLFAEDVPTPDAGPSYVMGVAPASATLAALTVRRPVASVLDLGTGSGVQAILAAEHAERVVATDINPRALGFAAFNAKLNDVRNIEFREGSFFDAVPDETFDLIVSNPPFVISPDTGYLFRDSGTRGDSLSADVVRGAATHLSDGGYATILVNWANAPDAPRAWVAGTGCDAWIVRSETHDALTYIGEWNRQSDPDDLDTTTDRWLAYYRDLGIERISAGTVILHKRTGRNWARVDELGSGGATSCSEHIVRVFENATFLEEASDEALLDATLFFALGHAVLQTLRCDDGMWTSASTLLRMEEGLHFEGPLDAGGLELLRLFDGSRTVRAALDSFASATNVDVHSLRNATLPVIRSLLGLGFLEIRS